MALPGSQILVGRSNENKWIYFQGSREANFFCKTSLLGTNKIEMTNAEQGMSVLIKNKSQTFSIPAMQTKNVPLTDEKKSHFINSNDGFDGILAPVGRFQPNQFGLFDMHGNVWEWCQDGFDLNYANRAKVDPVGTRFTDKYAIRGGCYL